MKTEERALSSCLIALLALVFAITPHRANAQWSYTRNLSSLTDLNQQARVGPAVTVDATGRVYLAWGGTHGPASGQSTLNIAYSSDGGITFSSAMNPLSATDWTISSAGPGIAVLNGNIYYAWTGGSNHINIAYAPIGTALSGAFTSHKSLVTISGAVQQSTGSVALAASNGILYLAWAGYGNNLINIATSTNGTAWTKSTIAYTSPYSPSLAAIPSGGAYLAWTQNNTCQYMTVGGAFPPKNCSGTLPNGGGTYTYAPVVGATGPGIVTPGTGVLSFFGACPYSPCNALFYSPATTVNTYLGYEIFTPAGSPNTLGISGNPAALYINSRYQVYFTVGTEIEVGTL